MDGILVIDKPSGPTSFDVVRIVRDALRAKKAGHTGTLDPLATGVLPICVGEATKIAGLILQADKSYDAVIRLGIETDTQDSQGQQIAQKPVPALTAATVEAVLERFRGKLRQRPPMYSAIKVGGKRLYELARAGEEVEREARDVEVHSLTLRDLSATEVSISLRCSKGFYVRVLASEVGEALGCGGHLKALRRTQTGPFTLGQSVSLAELEQASSSPEALAALLRPKWVPLAEALSELPAVEVNAADARKVLHGVPLEVRSGVGAGATVRVLGPDRRLLAVATVEPVGRLKYVRVLGGP